MGQNQPLSLEMIAVWLFVTVMRKVVNEGGFVMRQGVNSRARAGNFELTVKVRKREGRLSDMVQDTHKALSAGRPVASRQPRSAVNRAEPKRGRGAFQPRPDWANGV